MKIHITIDMLPSEVSAILEKLDGRPLRNSSIVVPESDSETARIVKVADNEMNRENAFWKERIGRFGNVVDERGGMWDVQFEGDPFPCKDLDPQRFTSPVA
jgi:uncharacterized glyoxalase superfamily protein PhnB